MRNTSFVFAYCFLTFSTIFGLHSNLIFAELTPMVAATPATTPPPPNVITEMRQI